MKLHKYLLYILILSTGLAACQNDELEAVTSDTTLEFYTSSQIQTRTQLQNGKTVLWQDGDKIAVYDFSAPKHCFTASITDGTAQFKGNITARCAAFFAAYPYEHAAENNVGQSIIMRLPHEQTAVQDGFASNTNLSVAKGERNIDGSPSQVIFHNICQLFKFNIPGYTAGRIASIRLTASTGLAGDMTVGFSGHNPTISLNDGASTSITLLPPTGTTVFAEGTYYFVVAPVEVNGFTLTLTDTEGKTYTQHSNSTVGGVWNVIYNLGSLDLIEKPAVTAQHVYKDGLLRGTTLSASTPTPDKQWDAVIKNASGTTVRTLASGMGTLTSDHTDANWPYLPTGDYTMEYHYTTANNKQMTGTSSFQITEKPRFSVTLNAASSYTYYLGDEVSKDVAKANSMDKNKVTSVALTLNGIDLAILNNPNYSYSVSNTFNGTTSGSTGNQTAFNDLSISQLGETTLSASVTFNGVTKSDDKKVWITGLPFNHMPPSLDVWKGSGDVTTESGYLRFGRWSGGSQSITYSGVNIPAGTRMNLNYHFICNGATVGTTFRILGGNQSWVSESSGAYSEKTFQSSKVVSNNDLTTQIKCENSYGAGNTGSDLYRVGLEYSE